jgi:hypothetical protein
MSPNQPPNEANKYFFNKQTWHDRSPIKHLNHHINTNRTTKKTRKTDTTTNITPHATETNKRTTGTDERLEKRNVTQKKYIRNPENIPYYEGDSLD